MRDSLERIGRFDPERARQRFVAGFAAEGLLLDHLYVRPEHQGRGIGAWVLGEIFQEADAANLPIRVGALRGSDSNRFYARHGFTQVEETEWDIYYVRRSPVHGLKPS